MSPQWVAIIIFAGVIVVFLCLLAIMNHFEYRDWRQQQKARRDLYISDSDMAGRPILRRSTPIPPKEDDGT